MYCSHKFIKCGVKQKLRKVNLKLHYVHEEQLLQSVRFLLDESRKYIMLLVIWLPKLKDGFIKIDARSELLACSEIFVYYVTRFDEKFERLVVKHCT